MILGWLHCISGEADTSQGDIFVSIVSIYDVRAWLTALIYRWHQMFGAYAARVSGGRAQRAEDAEEVEVAGG